MFTEIVRHDGLQNIHYVSLSESKVKKVFQRKWNNENKWLIKAGQKCTIREIEIMKRNVGKRLQYCSWLLFALKLGHIWISKDTH